ncbi:MAG: DNA-directed RNA polymerase subunit alpha, DNA-directed RNA polymerase subunit alpha [Candidatus Peregrinibacteria bacterium GW2011_GWF2_33_10]|nr:MAG: DNA-directed RNA polymerase subunit alpha, DNA-directed RNA polymerase subunit alpha [Candidatus Peregrinibacteria bacterium GW2011_GWF2_33_10]OGJ46112.1 MAG: DNA-directed RNA polymerase subunit alpha [Candidatus Peregrinibacteria bacterium RIFOXYA12_FULL_33_12]OGJ46183.1 MAG: DNA-directed RNA polymerase subunit alpha [Candidatus Peregrinibacteria bacterium RIFOXYA2_FULL_33_21]OGJ51599.1 MAG: DNA-directed RNA polymerase subunit alpha [Candidatus Peregrinibacteria bacterium RIFOXYB2_FULL_
MHILHEDIGVPKIKITKNGHDALVTISPLPSGYGITLGNALRRVLISSVPGAAIAGIKMDKVTHEYSVIKGVKDSVLDILLNLKAVRLKKNSKERAIVKLKASGVGEVLASNIEGNSDIIVLNPEQYITSITDKNTKLDMQLIVEKGVGYKPANLRDKDEEDASIIWNDAFFSPIKKIRYYVEPTRVGALTNLDCLNLEISTDGSILSEDALEFSASLLESYFSLFKKKAEVPEQEFISDFSKIAQKEIEKLEKKPAQESYTPVEILNFSPRTLNSLINGGIGSIEQLVQCNEGKLNNLRGFGAKALKEVKEALASRELALKEEE